MGVGVFSSNGFYFFIKSWGLEFYFVGRKGIGVNVIFVLELICMYMYIWGCSEEVGWYNIKEKKR